MLPSQIKDLLCSYILKRSYRHLVVGHVFAYHRYEDPSWCVQVGM